MNKEIENLKWQIHAETSGTHLVAFIICAFLVPSVAGKVTFVILSILNTITLWKSALKLPTNYYDTRDEK